MCGIAGFFECSNEMPHSQMVSVVRQMADALVHRGPDSSGTWADPKIGVALGHRRLSVIDLSEKGRQPMVSHCGRYITVFNGEIYNYRQLKQTLLEKGDYFKGDSDTEVMLAAISRWGVVPALKKLNGMFAVALLDVKDRKLYLARDRLGEKPLYYGWMGDTFLFASELKSMRRHANFKSEIQRGALALYLRYGYITSPHSIYQNIHKLPSASFLCLSLEADKKTAPVISSYWSFKSVAEAGLLEPALLTEEDYVNQLEIVLKDAVKLRMEADVPIGAFLSGGIDSSLIVALMQAQSKRRVRTFTMGFYEKGFNEAEEAGKIATHLGTEHTEHYVRPEEAMSVIPLLPQIYDEPFSDPSQIPTLLVSRLARSQVTVSLSGDGGDEIFGGYPRYFSGSSIFKAAAFLPSSGRRIFSKLIRSRFLPFFQSSAKIRKIDDFLQHHDTEKMYQELISTVSPRQDVVLNAKEPDTIFNHAEGWLDTQNRVQKMMYLDTMSYLPEDILTKVDRASMSVSLESRSPFLDPRVIEYAWAVPFSSHMKGGEPKYLLKKVLEKYVPPALFQRPKMGFGVPIGAWLRGPLKEWAEGLLEEKRLKEDGYFNTGYISEKWEEHRLKKQNHQYFLWSVLMFQMWHENQDRSSC